MNCDKVVCERCVCDRWCVTRMCVRDGARHRKCHACRAISAMPATQDEAGCNQVPRLPRETKVHVAKCHACHAKCHDVTGDQNGPKRATQCHKCHACHAKTRWLSPQVPRLPRKTEGICRQVPHLPRKVGRHHRRPSAPKRATRASPVP